MLSISVIINSCDRCDRLRKLLNALLNQTYDNFEVVVVVGPTTDDTIGMLNGEFEDSLIVESCPVYNLAVSRNIGLQSAQGEVVAFIDDDAIPCPTWLEQIVEIYNTQQTSSVGGRVLSVEPWHSQVQFCRGVVTAFAYQQDVLSESEYSSLDHEIWRTRLMGTNMTFRREDIVEIGGFDEEYEYLFDETDVCIRLWHSGRKVSFIDGATVYHFPANSRNRVIQSFDINWFSQVKSQIYFLIKNGSFENNKRVILSLLNTIYLISKNFIAMVIGGKLPGFLKWKVAKQHFMGIIAGIVRGLMRPRRFLSSTVDSPQRSFQRYQPILSPSNQSQPQPQRIRTVLFLSTDYPVPGTELFDFYRQELPRSIQGDKTEIHLLLPGSATNTVYEKGVYRHFVKIGKESRGEEYRCLINALTKINHDHRFDDLVMSFSDYLKLGSLEKSIANTIVFFDFATIDDLTYQTNDSIAKYQAATEKSLTLLLYPHQQKEKLESVLNLHSTYVESSILCRPQLIGHNDEILNDQIVMYFKHDQNPPFGEVSMKIGNGC